MPQDAGADQPIKRARRRARGAGLEVYPERLLEILPKLALFQGVNPKDFPKILRDFEWLSVPGGWTLMSKGEEGQYLYVLTAGSIGMWVGGADGTDYMSAHFTPGQTVGELAMLSGERRVGTLIALRDTELLRMSAEVFHELTAKYPVILENLAKLLSKRLHEVMRGERNIEEWRSVPKTVAVVPVADSGIELEIGEKLGLALAAMGGRVRLLDHQSKDQSSEWFYNVETHHEHVIYLADQADDGWTKLCLRQADRILLVGHATNTPPVEHPLAHVDRHASRGLIELALIHDAHAKIADGAAKWEDAIGADYLHNIRTGNDSDMKRMSRHLSGRATGLVLAGGGARGFAHIGVIRALREVGIPIDHTGGTSMGGIVAAGLALGWGTEELEERMHTSFVKTNPLGRLTFPSISLFTGGRIQKLLQRNFGDVCIEELWLPYFCVISNLTTGHEIVQRRGNLWRALRASVAIPGIAPPVVREGEVLVDGAVMNNFPADVMAEMRRGAVIGVDVETHRAFTGLTKGWEDNPSWGILGEDARGGPNIISILMRAGTVNSEAQTKASREHADLLFEPPVKDVAIRDWGEFRRVVDAGYAHAMEKLEATDLSRFGR